MKTLNSPFKCKDAKQVHLRGNQPWIFIGSIDAESEAPKVFLPNGKSHLFGKDLGAEKDWKQKEKEAAED